MPIRLPSNLPAFKTLSEEGVMMMSEDSVERQDIRPLEIGLLNLMPEKEKILHQSIFLDFTNHLKILKIKNLMDS